MASVPLAHDSPWGMNHEGSIGGIGSAELKQDTTFPSQPVIASRTCSWAICCGRSQTVDGDGYVDVFDLVGVIERFGDPCPQESFCPADLDEDGRVGIADLVLLLINMR